LAKDSVGESEATEIDPHEPDIYGKGKASLDEIYTYYRKIDFNVMFELGRFIRDELRPYRKFLESGVGLVPLFVKPDGETKLKREWPEIWESFELNNAK